MAIKPGPLQITVGAYTLRADSLSVTYDTQPFDRVEFDHEKLRSAPLSTGTQPQIVTLLGGKPAEIVIDCALTGMIGGASSYVPRPLVPNVYTSDTNNIKQRVNITRYKIAATSAESATNSTAVAGVFAYLTGHKNQISQFQNRLAVFNTTLAYEALLAAQADNIAALYFTTGITFTSPDYTVTNSLIVDGQFGDEFVVYNGASYDVYRTYDLTLEQRTVSSANSP